MEAEYLFHYNCGQRKVIEEFSKSPPNIGIAIFPKALVVEAINLSNLPALVVAS